MKTFEGLLAAFENATTDLDSEPSGSANFGGYRETYRAARAALVEHVRERMELPAELTARIERQRVRFAAEHDVRLTFADALRTLLDLALVGEEEREEEREEDHIADAGKMISDGEGGGR